MTAETLDGVRAAIADVSPSWERITRPAAGAAPATTARLGAARAVGVESIREGWLLHRETARVVDRDGVSPDLALLVGDWCYASGLCAIAEHGSLDDVATLAELIADVSTRVDEPLDALDARWSAGIEALADA